MQITINSILVTFKMFSSLRSWYHSCAIENTGKLKWNILQFSVMRLRDACHLNHHRHHHNCLHQPCHHHCNITIISPHSWVDPSSCGCYYPFLCLPSPSVITLRYAPCSHVLRLSMCKRGKMSQRPPKEEISPIPPIACVWMDDMAYAALEMDLTLGGISSCICFVEGFKIRNKTLLWECFLEYFPPVETDHEF